MKDDATADPRDLHFLYEASRRLNQTLRFGHLLQEIRDLLLDAMNAEAVSLLLWNEGRTRLEFALAYNRVPPEDERPSLAPGEGIGGWIAQRDASVIVNDASGDPRFRQVIDDEMGFETRNLIGLPLYTADRVFGVLEVLNRRTGTFGEPDLRLLEALADQISVALDHALLYQRARRQRAEVEALYRISLLLNEKLELDEILEVLLDQVRGVVPYDAAALYLIQPESSDLSWLVSRGYPEGTLEKIRLKLGEGIVGWAAKSGELIAVGDVHRAERYVEARPETRSEMVVPLISGSRVIGVLNLESDRLNAFRDDDQHVLTSFASQAAVSIERARMSAELLDKQRLEHELGVARSIQKKFLPRDHPVLPGYDIAGRNLPSSTVSGDAYDFVPITDSQFGIMIGDVSGKGVSAALIMATFRAALRAEIRNRFSIIEIMSKVNVGLSESVETGQFVTAVYGVLDAASGRFSYANAGHNAPILLRADGTVERLRRGGPILGPFPQIGYELGTLDLRAGDLLLFYTDGVTEAGAPEKEPYGGQRLIERLRASRELSSESIIDRILEDVRDYSERSLADDVTLIALRAVEPRRRGRSR